MKNKPAPTKSDIRTRIAALRPDFQTLEKWSAAVVENVQGLELFQQAETIGVYMPLPDEVNITPFFQGLETDGGKSRNFCIPAFDETLGSYRMAKHTPVLKKGKFGIPEPTWPVWAEADELDLILVPGLAFDQTGRRLGRGGGFYDRLLPQYNALRAGVCFDFQIVENFPTEPHDCGIDLLVTESKILKFAMNS